MANAIQLTSTDARLYKRCHVVKYFASQSARFTHPLDVVFVGKYTIHAFIINDLAVLWAIQGHFRGRWAEGVS
jgi:hypothetical protein